MNTVPINQIAKWLNVRPVRLEKKVNELNLRTLDEHSIGTLNFEDACTLVNVYAESNRVGQSTKERAVRLFSMFTEAVNKGVLILPENSIFKKSKTSKNKVHKRGKPTTLPLNESVPMAKSGTPVLYRFVHTLNNAIQSFIEGGVHSITSVHFKFVALVVAICVQMQHSAVWFYRISEIESPSWWTAYGYAFMVDLFILVITLEGKLSIAKTFAVLTFFANVLYFRFWVNFDYSAQAWTNAVSSLMVSGIMAYIIYAYTEIFVKIRK